MPTTVSAGGFGVGVVGLKELHRDLSTAANRALPRAVSKTHRHFATTVSRTAESKARRHKGNRRFADLITASGTQRSAAVRFLASRHPAAMGWLMGSKKFRQFERWVGGSQEAGFPELGPRTYAITPAIAQEAPGIAEEYEEELMRALSVVWT